MNIKFTYELELDKKLAFLDVCVTRINKNEIVKFVYRKATNNNIYINCHSHDSEKPYKKSKARKLHKTPS